MRHISDSMANPKRIHKTMMPFWAFLFVYGGVHWGDAFADGGGVVKGCVYEWLTRLAAWRLDSSRLVEWHWD
jgi:hypothetical protein